MGTPRSAAICASERVPQEGLELDRRQSEGARNAGVERAAHPPHPDRTRGVDAGHTGTLTAGCRRDVGPTWESA